MKPKRAKAVRRRMAMYCHTFGFREPYRVLVDGNFIQVCNCRPSVPSPRRSDLGQLQTRSSSCPRASGILGREGGGGFEALCLGG